MPSFLAVCVRQSHECRSARPQISLSNAPVFQRQLPAEASVEWNVKHWLLFWWQDWTAPHRLLRTTSRAVWGTSRVLVFGLWRVALAARQWLKCRSGETVECVELSSVYALLRTNILTHPPQPLPMLSPLLPCLPRLLYLPMLDLGCPPHPLPHYIHYIVPYDVITTSSQTDLVQDQMIWPFRWRIMCFSYRFYIRRNINYTWRTMHFCALYVVCLLTFRVV